MILFNWKKKIVSPTEYLAKLEENVSLQATGVMNMVFYWFPSLGVINVVGQYLVAQINFLQALPVCCP